VARCAEATEARMRSDDDRLDYVRGGGREAEPVCRELQQREADSARGAQIVRRMYDRSIPKGPERVQKMMSD
jgi:hypothetical protein